MHIGDFGVVEKEVEASASTSEPDTFGFYGETIRVRAQIGAYPMMRFASLVTTETPLLAVQTLAVLNSTLETCIDPEDWPTFQAAAVKHAAGMDVLQKVIENLYVVWAARPTQRPSGSSDGSPTDETIPPSNDESSDSSPPSKPEGSSSKKAKEAVGTG